MNFLGAGQMNLYAKQWYFKFISTLNKNDQE